MDIAVKLGYFIFDLLVPLIIGYLSKRQSRVGDSTFQRMMTFNIQVVYPLLSLLGFWVTPLNMELIWLPLSGLVASAIPGAIAFYWSKTKYTSQLDRGSYVIAALLPNNLVLGGIAAFILYGETGFIYTQLITLLSTAFVFVVCFPLAKYFSLSGNQEGSQRSFVSVLFNRNQLTLVGLLVGAGLLYSGVSRPAWLGAVFDPLVHIGAWTALIPVGRSVDFGEMRRYWRGTLDLIPIKFIVTPILTYALTSLVISDPLAHKIILVTTSTPTGIFAVVTVKLHELNIHITMAAFIITTVIYLLLLFPLQFVLFAAH